MKVENKEVMGEQLIVITKEKVKAPPAVIRYLNPDKKFKIELEVDYDYYKGLSKDDKHRLETIMATTVIQIHQVLSHSSYEGDE